MISITLTPSSPTGDWLFVLDTSVDKVLKPTLGWQCPESPAVFPPVVHDSGGDYPSRLFPVGQLRQTAFRCGRLFVDSKMENPSEISPRLEIQPTSKVKDMPLEKRTRTAVFSSTS